MADRLEVLIDELIKRAPDALLVVAQIIPFDGSKAVIDAFNAKIPGIVDTRAKAGKHIVMVDMNTGFTAGMLGDGVHPNKEGNDFMAEALYKVISSSFPKAP
jgi:lysophospholipase L1-like esterase